MAITGDQFDVAANTGIKGNIENLENKGLKGVYVGNVDGVGALDVMITQDAQADVTIDQDFINKYLGGTLGSVILDQDGNQDHKSVNIKADLTGDVTIDNDTTWDGNSADAIAKAKLNISGQTGGINIKYALDVDAKGFNKENLDITRNDLAWGVGADGYTVGETAFSATQARSQNVGTNLNIKIEGSSESKVDVSGKITTDLTTDAEGRGGVSLQQANIVIFENGGSSVTDTATYSNKFDIVANDKAKYDKIFGAGNWANFEDLSSEAKADFSKQDHWTSNNPELKKYSHIVVTNDDGSAKAYSHHDNYSFNFDSNGLASRTDPLNSVSYNGSATVNISGASQTDTGVIETNDTRKFVSRNEIKGNVSGTATQKSDITLIGTDKSFHSTSGNYINGSLKGGKLSATNRFDTRQQQKDATNRAEASQIVSNMSVVNNSLISRIHSSLKIETGNNKLYFGDISRALTEPSLQITDQEREAIVWLSDKGNFDKVSAGTYRITPEQLQATVAELNANK